MSSNLKSEVEEIIEDLEPTAENGYQAYLSADEAEKCTKRIMALIERRELYTRERNKELVDALEYVFNIAGGTSLEESEDALIAIQTQVTKVLSQHKESK